MTRAASAAALAWALTAHAVPALADAGTNDRRTFPSVPSWPPQNSDIRNGTADFKNRVDGLGGKFGQQINAMDFGADPTAARDSCAAITAAMNAVPACPSGHGASVNFPAGTYITSCWPEVTDKLIAIVGASNGPTQITFTSATNAGLKFTYNTTALAPQIRDISLVTVPSQSSNACITIKRPSSVNSGSMLGPLISHVNCSGVGASHWADGIVCTYCNFLTANRLQIVGANASGATVGATNMNRGIFLDSSIDANIYDSHIYFAKKGVSLDHDSEGLKLTSYSMVMVDWGVYAESNWSAPGLVIADGHINSTIGGIHIHGGGPAGVSTEAQIHDNLIYRWLGSNANPWIAFDCANGAIINGTPLGCTDHQFHHNNVIGFHGQGPAGPSYCFNLGSRTAQIQIQGNRCRQVDYFLNWGSSTAPTIDVSGNAALGLGAGWFSGANPNAVVHHNVPVVAGPNDVAVITMGLNATRWNLGGHNATTFITNASTATSVTDGFGGWPGLTVTIRCGDTNTTIASATGPSKFALAGGVAYTCPRADATISFTYSDQWREIGRAN